MNSLETPLHKVEGLGAAHSGTGHFWRQRITAVALIPLSLWLLYSALGLAGASEVAAIYYLHETWNALLMGSFVTVALYHASLGLQVVIDDYVHASGAKIFLLLLVRFCVIATWSFSVFALIRIAGQ